jgi:uncharacterized membrane protein YdfJ with MMPL/SSD domain
MISKDHREVLAVVNLKDSVDAARGYYGDLRAKVRSDSLDVTATNNVAVQHDFDAYLAADLQRAETVSLPLSLVLLLLVFAAVVAALLAYEHSLVRPGDLRRLDAAFFTVNGVISVVFFAFVLAEAAL